MAPSNLFGGVENNPFVPIVAMVSHRFQLTARCAKGIMFLGFFLLRETGGGEKCNFVRSISRNFMGRYRRAQCAL